MAVNENLLERREYKCYLPPHLVPYVREAARSVCKLDSYAGPDGSYTIRSLYFDNDRLSLYWANDAEVPDRFKARARMYPSAGPKGPVFLEIKRRVLDTIIKTRGQVPQAQWADIVRDPLVMASAPIVPKAKRAVERFCTMVHTWHLKPVVLVEYEREAYVSMVDDYARLTFDRDIRCLSRDRLEFAAEPWEWRCVDDPIHTKTTQAITLLELKFAGPAPRWMVDMVKKLELVRYSFSKYGYSINAQLTLPERRVPNIDNWRLQA